MHYIDTEATRELIYRPYLGRFTHLSEDEKKALQEIICGFKHDQLVALAMSLIDGVLPSFLDYEPEIREQLLKLAILDVDLSQQQLIEIFNLDLVAKEEDKLLKDTISKILKPDEVEQAYILVYTFRYKYFLGKYDSVSDNSNPNGFPVRIADVHLAKGHKHISKYLRESYQTTPAAKLLISKAYPEDKVKQKIFRRDAHEDVQLRISEIQALIIDAVQNFIVLKKIPSNLKPAKFVGRLLTHCCDYTGYIPNFSIKTIGRDITAPLETLNRYSGKTLLMWAVQDQQNAALLTLDRTGKIEEYMKNYGNRKDHTGYTILHYAIELDNVNLFKIFLRDKRNINKVDQGGYTAIYLAAEAGKVDFVLALLEAGADPNLAKNRHQSNALHIAIWNCNIEVVKALVKSGKMDMSAMNKKGLTAEMLARATGNADIVSAIKLPTLAPPPPQQVTGGAVPKVGPPASNIAKPPAAIIFNDKMLNSLKKSFMSPKTNRDNLEKIHHLIGTSENPYKNVIKIKEGELGKRLFSHSITSEDQDMAQSKVDLDQLRAELQFVNKQNWSFAKKYQTIFIVIEGAKCRGLPLLAIVFELVRENFIEHYICLFDDKKPMQVAIETEDMAFIKEELASNPRRENDFFSFEGKLYSIMNYAISMGKEKVVAELMNLLAKNPNLKLGETPRNSLELAQRRAQELSEVNPAFSEVEEYHQTNVIKASEQNWKRLLRNLQKTLPSNTINAVNGFFTAKEFELLTILLAEKRMSLRRVLSNAYARFIMSVRLLEKDQRELEAAKKYDDLFYRLFDKAHTKFRFNNLKKIVVRSHWANQPPPQAEKIENIYKHATDYSQLIHDYGKLITVQEVHEKTGIKGNTPEGTRKNIFFSQNSPLARLTTLRNTAKFVVEVNIAKAVENKLVDPKDIYTSPHLPAFNIERIENPIFLRGKNLEILTIYRVCHLFDPVSGKKFKQHRFDYYYQEKYIKSHLEEYALQDEFFVGDNIKATGYRLIYLLRLIRGPFAEGSYTDYFYENIYKAKVINSLKAVLFNVFNVEAKVTKGIALQDGVVKVVENQHAQRHAVPPTEQIRTLYTAIKEGTLESFKKCTVDFALHREQLESVLIEAVVAKKKSIVNYLLSLGVRISSRALMVALSNLAQGYKNLVIDPNDSVIADMREIVSQLLLLGSRDEFDSEHIQHGAAIENCIHTNNDWSHTVSQNFKLLCEWVTAFDGTDVQDLFINSVSRSLPELYHYTFREGHWDSHIAIANRLGKPCAYESVSELINQLKNSRSFISLSAVKYIVRFGSVEDLNSILTLLPLPEHQTELLHYSLRLKKISMIEFFLLKNTDRSPGTQDVLFPAFYHLGNDKLTSIFLTPLCDREALFLRELDSARGIQATLLARVIDFTSPMFLLAKRNSKFSMLNGLAAMLLEVLDTKNPVLIEAVAIAMKAQADKIPSFIKTVLIVFAHAASTFDKEKFYLVLPFVSELTDTFVEHLLGDYFISEVNDASRKSRKLKSTTVTPALLETIIRTATLDNLETIMHQIQGASSLDRSLTEDHEGDNFLHKALMSNDPEKFKYLSRKFPTLKLLNKKYDEMSLYKRAIDYCENKPEILNLLLSNGIALPTQLPAKITLLAHAVTHGFNEIIRWFFNTAKMLDKNIVEPQTGRNLLQILLLQVDNNILSKHETVIFLVNEIGIDINHLDSKNLHFMFYAQAKILLVWLVLKLNKETLNCALVDSDGNTLLHVAQLVHCNQFVVDHFIKRGGNIHAINKNGVSIYEHFMEVHPGTSTLPYMASLGCVARKTLPSTAGYFIATRMVGADFYLLMDKTGVCIFDEKMVSDNVYKKAKKIIFEDRLFSIRHLDKGTYQQIPRDNFARNFLKQSSLLWVKVPADAIVNNEIAYQFIYEGQIIKLNKLTRLFLRFIKNNYSLRDAIGQQLNALCQEHQQRLADAYQAVIAGDVAALQAKFNIFKPVFLDNSMPYLIRLKNAESYTTTAIYSALTMAAACNKMKVLEFLVSQGLTYSKYSYYEHGPITAAKNEDNYPIVTYLLTNKIEEVSPPLVAYHLLSQLSVLEKSTIEFFNYLNLVMDCILKMDFSAHNKSEKRCKRSIIGSLNSYLQSFEGEHHAQMSEKIQQVIRHMKGKTQSKNKRAKEQKEDSSSESYSQEPKRNKASSVLVKSAFFRKRKNVKEDDYTSSGPEELSELSDQHAGKRERIASPTLAVTLRPRGSGGN